jgi:hypothetical protein
MNYLLRLIMVGLLVVACVWGIQPAALEDTEALSPSLLLTDQELDIPTEMLVEQPEMHVTKTARAILDQFPYLSASATEKVHKNAANLVATTYQSNDSSLKSTGGNGSHDSSAGTGPRSEVEDYMYRHLPMCIGVGIGLVIFLAIAVSCYLYRYGCCCPCSTGTNNRDPHTVEKKNEPYSKRYRGKVPSMSGRGRYQV